MLENDMKYCNLQGKINVKGVEKFIIFREGMWKESLVLMAESKKLQGLRLSDEEGRRG